MTTHQLAEIYHAFSFRGKKIPTEQSKAFLLHLQGQKNIKIVEVQKLDYEQALRASEASNIHIWDYLCILPLKGKIQKIITCDAHFQHKSLQIEGTELKNPIDTWLTL